MKRNFSKGTFVACVALIFVVCITLGLTIHFNREAKRQADEYIASLGIKDLSDSLSISTEPASAVAGFTDAEIAASKAIAELQNSFAYPDSFQIHSNIVYFNPGSSDIDLYCVQFGVNNVLNDRFISPIEGEVMVDNDQYFPLIEGDGEDFLGWRQEMTNAEALKAMGTERIEIDGAKVAEILGVSFTDVPEENTSVPTNANTPDANNPLVLKEYGYFESLGALYIVGVMENTGADLILYPQINVKAKNSSGDLVGAGDGVGGYVFPGQTTAFSLYICEAPSGLATVECQALPPQDYAIVEYPSDMYPEYKPIYVVNDFVLSDRVVCEVINPNNFPISVYTVTVVFRDSDGNICAGYTGYSTALPANGSVGFEIPAVDYVTYSSYEIYTAVQ